MPDPVVVAERIFLAAVNKAKRKNVVGYFAGRGIGFLCDIAVQHGISKDEWFRDFATAYDKAVEYAAGRAKEG